ncbi:MAG: hypothetical protein AUK48_11460 [Oscillatoriales cyanobacterium CG2_30_44_21]|nr:MAG: hypothetical protein AUK48_11460 [Oscillatoriales cyanobacterium CG2_30_44_21]
MKKQLFGSLSLVATLAILPIAIFPAIANSSLGNQQQSNLRVAQNQQRPVALLLSAEIKKTSRDADGKEVVAWNQLPSNPKVVPGSVLRYTVTAENTTNRNMQNLSVTQPVPGGMVYVIQSATKASADNASVDFSIDGGKSFSPKPVVRVRGRDGKVVERPAPPEAYTHVRWNFGETLSANSRTQVSYQVRVK